jgi:hypothetical protein
MSESPEELAYYSRVEDLFATLRGLPHSFSPKDIHLLRTWWAEHVPYTAIVAGLTEVFDRRSAEGEADPVVSLHFCRHAVAKAARRLAEARVGARQPGGSGSAGDRRDQEAAAQAPGPEVVAQVAEMQEALRRTAARLAETRPGVAGVAASMVRQLDVARDLPAEAIEEHLFSLEIALLDGCRRALDPASLQELEARATEAAAATGASGGELRRLERAWLDREVRELLGLPRLDLST